MTSDTGDEAWAPEACTLPTAQRPVRVAEFDALFTTAVRRADRIGPAHLRLTLTGPPGLAATVADLTARESRCCAFFTFTVRADRPGHVVLDVEVPPAHTGVLDALADRAAARGAR